MQMPRLEINIYRKRNPARRWHILCDMTHWKIRGLTWKNWKNGLKNSINEIDIETTKQRTRIQIFRDGQRSGSSCRAPCRREAAPIPPIPPISLQIRHITSIHTEAHFYSRFNDLSSTKFLFQNFQFVRNNFTKQRKPKRVNGQKQIRKRRAMMTSRRHEILFQSNGVRFFRFPTAKIPADRQLWFDTVIIQMRM